MRLGTTKSCRELIFGMVFICGVFCAPVVWAEPFAGGTGEPNDPYQLASNAQLMSIGSDPNLLNKAFILVAELDLNQVVFDRAVIAPDTNDASSDYQGTMFSGSFDGQGLVIKGLYIEGENYLGLFGALDGNAVVLNLGLESLEVNGVGDYVGGLAGYNEGEIRSCCTSGNICGDRCIGGLVGRNVGAIVSSYSKGAIYGGNEVGGLIGSNVGSISLSYNEGSVTGEDGVGGLAGGNSDAITLSYNTGSVNGETYTGGLLGSNSGVVTSCYNTGLVTAVWWDNGGLVGVNGGTVVSSYNSGTIDCAYGNIGGLAGENGGLISACFNSGSIRDGVIVGALLIENDGVNRNDSHKAAKRSGLEWNEYIGGLVGLNNYGTIIACYSTGVILDGDWDEEPGGLVGGNDGGVVTLSFWDVESSSVSESDGGVGLTTLEMQSLQTYLDANWDWAGETGNGTNDFWQLQEGSYPSLAVFSGWMPPIPAGSGTSEDPYRLTDANELGTVWFRPDAYYRLDTDIDLAGICWNSSVIPGLCRSFDGNDHVISNLKIEGGGHLGLFGVCTSQAIVLDLQLDAVDVNGVGWNVGGLAGWNKGNIQSVRCDGLVSGDFCVGGIGGGNTGEILRCSNAATVTGNTSIGGIVGSNSGGVDSNVNLGRVTGISAVGGLVGGSNWGEITSCYNLGMVHGVDDVGGLVGYLDNPFGIRTIEEPFMVIKISGVLLVLYGLALFAIAIIPA